MWINKIKYVYGLKLKNNLQILPFLPHRSKLFKKMWRENQKVNNTTVTWMQGGTALFSSNWQEILDSTDKQELKFTLHRHEIKSLQIQGDFHISGKQVNGKRLSDHVSGKRAGDWKLFLHGKGQWGMPLGPASPERLFKGNRKPCQEAGPQHRWDLQISENMSCPSHFFPPGCFLIKKIGLKNPGIKISSTWFCCTHLLVLPCFLSLFPSLFPTNSQ